MPKKTSEELAEIEFAALAEAIMEMEALKKEDLDAPAAEALALGALGVEAPAGKPSRARKPRAKKEEAPAAKPRRTRAPRKKAPALTFVIQNSENKGITYEEIVEKVQAAVKAADVTSLDIYIKSEEGMAYYVVNGEAAGSIELF